MPQELQVLRCYSCEAFQVHIVKKSLKWECKICGEKQSIKKVYGRGSGKDCRLYVQELNQKRLERYQEPLAAEQEIESSDFEKNIYANVVCNNDDEPKPNRWAKFISSSTTVSSDEEVESNEIPNYTFEGPIKKRKRTPLNKKCSKTTLGEESLINKANNEESSSAILTMNEKVSNCASDKKEKENLEIFNQILSKRCAKQKRFEVNQKLKESHIKETSNGYPFSEATSDETSVGVKSNRWAEFISTETPSDEEMENCFEDLITNKIYKNALPAIDTDANAVYKSNDSHLQSSSKRWNEFKEDENQFVQNKVLTNSSSRYHKASHSNSNLKFKKVSNLFNDGENNLDSIFTF